MSLDAARESPVQTVLSGPAGGVSGAVVRRVARGLRPHPHLRHGRHVDRRRRLRVGGAREITRETQRRRLPRARPGRRRRESIGAGGGSIAYVAEATGALRVGPQSAGADPGPGLLRPRRHAARPSPTRTSCSAICRRACSAARSSSTSRRRTPPSRASPRRAAPGVEETRPRRSSSIVDEAMLGALRVVTVQRGRAPSEFALVAFGGAGGLHANALAAHPRLLPGDRAAGVRRAVGARVHRLRHQERVQPDVRRARSPTTTPDARARAVSRRSTARRRDWLDAESVDVGDQDVRFIARHALQPPGLRDPDRARRRRARRRSTSPALDARASARRTAGSTASASTGGAEIVEPAGRRAPAACRCPSSRRAPRRGEDPSAAQTGTQHRLDAASGPLDVPTYARAALEPGMAIDGYAIVEQYDATTVVLPGHVADGRPVDEPR